MIYDVIKGVIVNELGIEEQKFQLNAFIEKDLELDSTETVAVALALKKHFKVEYLFPKTDVTIQEIINDVESKIKAIA